MSIPKTLIIALLNPKTYLWIDVLLIKETKKAILIEFNGRKAWFPKAWIMKINPNQTKLPRTKCPRAASIKISEYNWDKKF